MKDIVIVGGGGHCHSCIDVIEQQGIYSIVGIIDIKEQLGAKILGYPVIGRDEDIPEISKDYRNFHIAVGKIKSPAIRIKIYNIIKAVNGELPVIVSPLAYLSHHAKVGEGTILMHYVMVNAGSNIGVNCIINSRALIEHDVYIGNHCHVSTGAILNGEAQLGNESFFGSGAVSVQGTVIPDHSFIKANSLVK